MQEPLSNPRIIVDASFIRGMSADGGPFRAMADRGDRIVIIDNLAFELCSTANRAQWPASQLKLMHCRENIECWHNSGVMLRIEGKRNKPYGDPLFPESTEIARQLLAKGSPYTPDDLEEKTEAERETREGEIIAAMFRAFRNYEPLAQELSKLIEGKAPEDENVSQLCHEFVNNPDNIRFLMNGGPKLPNPDEVDDAWVTWHHYKSFLAAFCEYLRRGCPDFEDLSDNGRKRWINIKHDLEYLVSLAFGDAIASRETSGEQNPFRRWMFGESKPLITLADF